jgi:hypothetical protein
MCKFISGITLQNGDVKISNNTDSHHEILTEFGISDSALPPAFVAWEFSPPNNNYSLPVDQWIFAIDDQFPTPDWWDNGFEKITITDCKLVLQTILLSSGKHTVKKGRFFSYGSATVEAYDSATVEAYGSATVRAYDSATVEAYGSATVRAYGSATVRAYDSATVTQLSTNSKITITNSAVVINRSLSVATISTAKNIFEDK